MTLLPKWFTGVLEGFAPLFSARIWPQIQLLVVGALLSPGDRTVTAALRVLGLADDTRFGTFHRLLSRARWSSPQASRVLLDLLLAAYVPSGRLRNSETPPRGHRKKERSNGVGVSIPVDRSSLCLAPETPLCRLDREVA